MKRYALIVAALAALAACSKEEAPKTALVTADGDHLVLNEPDKADFLKIATVDPDKGRNLRLPGRLVWNEEKTVRVYPQLGGRIQRVLVDVGADVKAGQSLAMILSPDYDAARADAVRASAQARVATQAVERNRELKEAGIVAEKDWQQVQADALAAKADAERAAHRLAGLGGDGGSYALKSPLAGIVVERNLNPGMEFRPDQASAPLFVVTDPRSLWLQLDASEDSLRHIKVGETLSFEVKQYPGEKFSGVIRNVADFVNPDSRTVKVRCDIDNADRRLKGEMFAQAVIALPPADTLRIPTGAVMLFGSQRYVLLEEERGRYRLQAITTAGDSEGATEVLSGLKAGDKVVAEGGLQMVKYFRTLPGSDK